MKGSSVRERGWGLGAKSTAAVHPTVDIPLPLHYILYCIDEVHIQYVTFLG